MDEDSDINSWVKEGREEYSRRERSKIMGKANGNSQAAKEGSSIMKVEDGNC